MNLQASKSHWQVVAQLMQLHAEAELAKSFQRVPQHPNQHSSIPSQHPAPGMFTRCSTGLHARLSSLLARSWSSLPCEDCSAWPQKTGPSALIWSERSSSALPARDASEGAQQPPERSPPWASHAGSSWCLSPQMQTSTLTHPRILSSSACSLPHLLQPSIRGSFTPTADFGTVWCLLGCSDRHSPGDVGTVGMVRVL